MNCKVFKLAKLLFSQEKISQGNTNTLLDIWAHQNVLYSLEDNSNIFATTKELYITIDSIQHGSAPW